MRLLIYDTEMQTANGYLPKAIVTAAGKLLGASNVHLCGHEEIVENASSGAWDGLLAIGGAGADRHIMTALMEIPIMRILWSTEDPYERRLIKNAEPAFHYIFSNDQSCDGANAKTSFLPLAAEPELHFRSLLKSDNCYDFDVTFVGTAWPNRVASLERIFSALPENLNIFCCLPWNRHIPQPRLQTVGVIPQLRMDISDLCDIWNRSRIVLTIGREFALAPDGEEQVRGISPPPRIYETALAGGRQIVLGGSHFELPGKYADLIPIANDEGDAAELIRQYLAKPEARIFDAIKAQDYTLEAHTYEKRLRLIIEKFKFLEQEQAESSVQKSSIHTAHQSQDASSHPAGILHVAHNLMGLERGGGTELYVDSLASWQKLTSPERTVLALAPIDSTHLAVMDYRNGRSELASTIETSPISPFSSSHQDCERTLCNLISKYHISVVHFHHLKGLPLSLPIFAQALGCRVVVTLHDFYMLCDRYTLLRPNDTFCEVHKYPDHRHLCRICLQSRGLQEGSRNRRLEITRRSITAADCVLASTASSAEIASEVFPDKADSFKILEMVTPQLELLHRGRSARPSGDSGEGPLRVAVIGNAVRHKGLKTLIEVIGASRGLPLEFHIFGATDELDHFLNAAGISPSQASIATYTHGYKRAAMINALQNLHVALFLSNWPETYNISLGEAMYMGVVPIATNLGAQSDRIKHEMNGLLVSPHDSQAVLQLLLELHADRGRLSSLRNGAMAIPLMDIEQHGQRLEQIYSELQPWRFAHPMNDDLLLNTQLNLTALGVRLGHDQWNENAVLWDNPA